jgi:hypothetical protein
LKHRFAFQFISPGLSASPAARRPARDLSPIFTTPKLTATAYFGYAQGLSVMKTIYPVNKDGRFGYLELNVRF